MRASLCAAAAVGCSGGTGLAGGRLQGYKADISQTSVSGISSGAFMAVQFATAWSSVIRGVGVIAGGPFYCAQASWSDILTLYTAPVFTAAGPCMTGPAPAIKTLEAAADHMAAAGDIDPLSNLAEQKIYVFHGYNDAIVARAVTDDTVAFYRHYLGAAHEGNLFYQTTYAAGHAQVIAESGMAGLNPCAANQSPYINQCGYDQAGILLQHIYGRLNPPNAGALSGHMKSFSQSLYTAPFTNALMSLASTGYVYVPARCEQGATCRVHIALHGCLQDHGEIGSKYIDEAGYNRWADTNGLIMLYPQTEIGDPLLLGPVNPQACWDWFAYINHDSSYVTKSGRQIQAIKAMLDALTGHGTPAPTAASAASPPQLLVIDTSDVAAALAWAPVAGADSYVVYRSAADGTPAPVGNAMGPSFADAGLMPGVTYAWRVSAVVGGETGPMSAPASASTRQPAPPCPHPGTC